MLRAPDLQPAAGLGPVLELGQSPAASPPVLSWQGSPVSSLEEDEEELEPGPLIGPVLQPSPTHSGTVSHGDAEEGRGGRDAVDRDHGDDERAEGCHGDQDAAAPGAQPRAAGLGEREEEEGVEKEEQEGRDKDGEKEDGECVGEDANQDGPKLGEKEEQKGGGED